MLWMFSSVVGLTYCGDGLDGGTGGVKSNSSGSSGHNPSDRGNMVVFQGEVSTSLTSYSYPIPNSKQG